MRVSSADGLVIGRDQKCEVLSAGMNMGSPIEPQFHGFDVAIRGCREWG